MLVLSLSVRGLECSFHRLIYLYVFCQIIVCAIQRAKLLLFFRMAKFSRGNFASVKIKLLFIHMLQTRVCPENTGHTLVEC